MLGRRLRFSDAQFRRAARSHITCREVKHAGAIAKFTRSDKRSSAGLFHVIRMRCNRQDVERAQVLEWLVWIVHR